MRQKILLLNQVFYPDGAATAQHTTDLALFLQENGYAVTVVTGKRNYNHRNTVYSARENFHGIEIVRVGSTGFGKKNFLTRFIDALTFELLLLLRLAVMPRQDTVMAFTSPPLIGVIAAVFCFFKGGKLVNWLMDINPDAAIAVGYIKPKSFAAKFLNWVFEVSLKRSDRVVVLDRWMKSKIEHHGIPADRIVVVPPWPVQDLEVRRSPTELNPLRQTHGLLGRFVVLYSGNHSIVHPLDTLLDAAVRLKQDPTVAFVFIGGGLRVGDVTAAVEEHGLQNVWQLPHQPREMLDASLSLADLHVVVMGNEVSGLVHTSKIYGILATGAPYVAIAPQRSHLGDLIDEYSTGYHVEHGDVDGLVAAIGRARSLATEELSTIERINRGLIENRFTAAISLKHFAEQVLGMDRSVATHHHKLFNRLIKTPDVG